jgi:bacterioferritin
LTGAGPGPTIRPGGQGGHSCNDPRIIDLLNQVLRKELTGINQYFIHSRMCKNWGYAVLEKVAYDEAIEEMKHADLVIQRILFLEGVPNLADYTIGSSWAPRPGTSSENDLALEHAALSVLRPGVALCLEIGDHGTRDLLEKIVVDEEHHIDWIEAQRHKIGEVGYQQYLAQQIYA